MVFFAVLYGNGLAQSNSFINGADLSCLPQIEANNGKFYSGDTLADAVQLFADNEVNYARFRLWHTPKDNYCNLQNTIIMAARAKQAGMKVLLDFHYSDTWADPGNQEKPAAWKNVSYPLLLDSIYNYTYSVIHSFDSLGVLPDMVQIGNEINPGILWPEGRINGTYNTTQQWTQFTQLLKMAIKAVHDASSDTVKIVLHIGRDKNSSSTRWFYDKMRSFGVEYDIIGQSFYPWWHGNFTGLKQDLNDIALRYNKDIIIAETAYPWTLSWNDNTGNIVGSNGQLLDGYPASVQGQYSFLYDLIQIIKDVPGGKGIGLFYWAPDWISTPTFGSTWENLALFNFRGEALQSLRVFKEAQTDTSNAINVTFTLNTSTNYDTLNENGFVQMRGEVANGTDILASGEELAWNINSGVVLNNINGDYWAATIRVVPGSEIHYAYWTGHSKTKPTFLRLGSEGPIIPFNNTSGNVRKFIAGTTDTVLAVEYYNGSGTAKHQYWRPFESKEDSVAVYLRVNMTGMTSAGKFNPINNGPLGIRGNEILPGILSWENTNVFFQRETLSVSGGAVWSGTVYYPKTASGNTQDYKFYIENNPGNEWEYSIDNRLFEVPVKDTTIHWVYFNNNIITGVEEEFETINSFMLYQNYPNPFNNSTLITFELKENKPVQIMVYDILGRKVRDLVKDELSVGIHRVYWNAKDNHNKEVSSGIYFIKMNTGGYNKSVKALLLK